MMMYSLAVLLSLCASVCASSLYINQYTGADGKLYYYTAVYCNNSGSLLQTSYYASLRSNYTTRYDKDCCYLVDSRNQCCMQAGVNQTQECRCATAVTCGLQPKIDPTSTTTPTSTDTTYTTTDSTTPTASTTTTTTTTAVATTPSTTAPPSLCQPSYRILSGAPVSNECSFAGIARITSNLTTVTCNAVLATATVNGTLRRTFVTLTLCKLLLETNNSFELSIDEQNFPISPPLFTMVEGSNGISFITLADRYVNLLSYLGKCQTSSCPYNAVTMKGQVDFNDCKVASWGVSTAGVKEGKGLFETAVRLNPNGCTKILNLFGVTNTMCFTSVSGKNLYCSGDQGAPVYCRAPANGEWILVGSVAYHLSCNSSPEFKVIPFPG